MIRFGVGPAGAGEDKRELRDRAARVLAHALGDDVSVVELPRYADLQSALEEGNLELAWLPPLLCVRALDAKREVLVVFVRERGTLYHGAIFVPASARKYRPEDLDGAHVAWVDEHSCAGYLFPRAELVARAIEPHHLFARESMLGSHRAVVRAVAEGSADCGAAYLSSRLDGSTRAAWPAGTMRAILVSPPIPSDGICACASLSDPARVKEVLARLHESEEGKSILRDLFDANALAPTEANHFDPVRAALRALGRA